MTSRKQTRWTSGRRSARRPFAPVAVRWVVRKKSRVRPRPGSRTMTNRTKTAWLTLCHRTSRTCTRIQSGLLQPAAGHVRATLGGQLMAQPAGTVDAPRHRHRMCRRGCPRGGQQRGTPCPRYRAVDYRVRGRRPVIDVTDDGVGLPDTVEQSGLGNVAQRATGVGGLCRSERVEAGGTRLVWTAPLA